MTDETTTSSEATQPTEAPAKPKRSPRKKTAEASTDALVLRWRGPASRATTLALPAGAAALTVEVNGAAVPFEQNGRTVTIDAPQGREARVAISYTGGQADEA